MEEYLSAFKNDIFEIDEQFDQATGVLGYQQDDMLEQNYGRRLGALASKRENIEEEMFAQRTVKNHARSARNQCLHEYR
jgi:conjugal transfer/entry exclusion protein